MVTARLAFLDQDLGFAFGNPIHTITVGLSTRDEKVIDERIGGLVSSITLLITGVKRFKAHAFDGGLEALSRVVEHGTPPEIVEPDVSRFYRGLAYLGRVDDGTCLN